MAGTRNRGCPTAALALRQRRPAAPACAAPTGAPPPRPAPTPAARPQLAGGGGCRPRPARPPRPAPPRCQPCWPPRVRVAPAGCRRPGGTGWLQRSRPEGRAQSRCRCGCCRPGRCYCCRRRRRPPRAAAASAAPRAAAQTSAAAARGCRPRGRRPRGPRRTPLPAPWMSAGASTAGWADQLHTPRRPHRPRPRHCPRRRSRQRPPAPAAAASHAAAAAAPLTPTDRVEGGSSATTRRAASTQSLRQRVGGSRKAMACGERRCHIPPGARVSRTSRGPPTLGPWARQAPPPLPRRTCGAGRSAASAA